MWERERRAPSSFPLLPTPFFFPPLPLLISLLLLFFFFFFSWFFFTSLVVPAIPLLILHCLRPPSTILCCSSPLHNLLGFKFNFLNLDLVSSTSFTQSRAHPLCSPAPQLPIGVNGFISFTTRRPVRYTSLAEAIVADC
jgi:hypothetical protein